MFQKRCFHDVWLFFELLTCTCIQEMLFPYFKAVPSLNNVVPKLLNSVLIMRFLKWKEVPRHEKGEHVFICLTYCFWSFNMYIIQEMLRASRKCAFSVDKFIRCWTVFLMDFWHKSKCTQRSKNIFTWHVWLSVFEFLISTFIKKMTFLYIKEAPFVRNILASCLVK